MTTTHDPHGAPTSPYYMDLFKLVFTWDPVCVAHSSTGKQTVSLRLKGFLLDVIISYFIEAKSITFLQSECHSSDLRLVYMYCAQTRIR